MFGHVEKECRKKQNRQLEWRVVPQTAPDADQEKVQQPQVDGFTTPRRMTRAVSPTRTDPGMNTTNIFQILIENEIRELVTHENGVRTPPHG